MGKNTSKQSPLSEDSRTDQTIPEKPIRPKQPNRTNQKLSDKTVTQKDLNTLKDEMINLIDQKLSDIKGMIEMNRTVQKESDGYCELAPQPPLDGKKYTTKREKLGVTLDSVLMKKANEECHDRRISMSRLIDTALWHYFEKPTLSFEDEKNE